MTNYTNPTKKSIRRKERLATFFRVGTIFWCIIAFLAMLNACTQNPYPTRYGYEGNAVSKSSVNGFPVSRSNQEIQETEETLVLCYCTQMGEQTIMKIEDCKRCKISASNSHPEIGFDPTTWSKEKQDRLKRAINGN